MNRIDIEKLAYRYMFFKELYEGEPTEEHLSLARFFARNIGEMLEEAKPIGGWKGWDAAVKYLR